MFNLDHAIKDWRRQMLAADIKAPEPMDELEAHLRDEIEQQAKSGLSGAEAFQAAVEKIGKAHPIQQEFKKVEKGHKIIRQIALIVGWLAAGFALEYFVEAWEWTTLFVSSSQWQPDLIRHIPEILFALTALWFLAKMSRDKTSRAVSLLICVLLAWHGLRDLLTKHGWPFWFRYCMPLVEFVPGIFWLWWMRRHLAQKRGSTRGNQPIHSD
jgi:hypothetical protein